MAMLTSCFGSLSLLFLSPVKSAEEKKLVTHQSEYPDGPSPEKSDEMQKLIADEKKKFDDGKE
ncbi:hypothetical protein MAR_017535 [Mya arenaria]|uniref:Uncharacterized protein n=1 Tax=Mya arenaria TaxID=6604 RepID=A0ABY7EF87_MYAAR|nr:hypothetical protein MAR_017534 [Mya arenaria]WAR07577.1 hypothetical protein MAR_017535 [Mya arenaria]